MVDYKKIHFIGIGGIGMSAIAQILSNGKSKITGSDRNFDLAVDLELKRQLEQLDIQIFKQDGSGVDQETDLIVYSTSIETQIPDLVKAKELNINIKHRSDMLADIFNHHHGIAISGTSGKTTSCGMLGYVLYHCQVDPNIINGGKIINFYEQDLIGNAYNGKSDYVVIEADESDGSLVNYTPNIAVINNIDLDHKPIEELNGLFITFANSTSDYLILNSDCPNIKKIKSQFQTKTMISYGEDKDSDYVVSDVILKKNGSEFKLKNDGYQLQVPGFHNVMNSIPAIIIAQLLTIDKTMIKEALAGFKGIKRRSEIVKHISGIDIIDDYAHNPSKIKASIQSTKLGRQNIIAVFQPHGFAPTKFMKQELIEVFLDTIHEHDLLFLPEIFYAGGTVSKDISSQDLVDEVNKRTGYNKNIAYYFENREDINLFLRNNKELLEDKQAILVMGARDNTLSDFSRNLTL